MKTVLKALTLASLVYVSSSLPAMAATRPTVTLLGTALSDATSNVRGFAGFQSLTRKGKTNTYFELVLSNLRQPANTTLNILVNGTRVATTTVKPGRKSTTKAHLLLNSTRGDLVPAITAGSTITIVEAIGGTTIASGTFRKFN